MPARVSLPPSSPDTPRVASPRVTERRVALLRGVNVGGKQVAMADLRRIAESLGFAQVSTLINSGNLVYERSGTAPADDAQHLHDAIADALGVRCTVFVRTRDEVDAILRECPLAQEARENPSRLLVTLWDAQVTADSLEAFAATPVTVEQFIVGPRALYCWLPDGISASVPYETASRRLGAHITARNWSTMEKLFARLNGSAP